MEKSEYGKGLVICLVKFVEHFHNDMASRIAHVHMWHTKLKGDMEALKQYDKSMRQDVELFIKVELAVHKEYTAAFSQMLEMWANGATDHLQEMSVPDTTTLFAAKMLPLKKKVNQLRALGLNMGHGFRKPGTVLHTWEDMCKLRKLSHEIALLIDRGFLDLTADEGKWA